MASSSKGSPLIPHSRGGFPNPKWGEGAPHQTREPTRGRPEILVPLCLAPANSSWPIGSAKCLGSPACNCSGGRACSERFDHHLAQNVTLRELPMACRVRAKTRRRICRRAIRKLLDAGLPVHEAIVRAYIKYVRPDARAELALFSREQQPSFRAAVRAAALSRIDGVKHSHQWRIPPESLSEMADILEKANLQRAPSFEWLRDRIERVTAGVWRIGDLTVYDVAQRIGVYLGLEPERIYLHAGTKLGARALGLPTGKPLRKQQLPAPYWRLSAAELEDVLCIFKAVLQETRGFGSLSAAA